MTPEQFRRLEALYDAAMAVPAAERARFVNEQCGGDEDLRRELLAALDDSASGLTDVVHRAVSSAVEREADWTGRRIGPYRIVRPLGRGGMGAVFLAVRDDDQFRKDVAIKTLKFELAGDAAVARFRRERQILAHLEHPNIARLLDGGATEHGTPYIVLEYVAGMEIAAWCDRQQLSIEQRLRLFLQVCDAVQYAHQHLVVHRDLKPANILVAQDGVPKLLDFGIAKLLESGGIDAFEHGATATSALLMTPDYVSPEQVRGGPVSTVTDVYSLGAVLFELLTGERPHQLEKYDAVEIARVVCDTEVRPPSALGNRRLRGDLDTIVLKAMDKDPARRYSSVAGFAQDIRRHLDGMPIDARPDARFYRAAKFLRRHRVGALATAAVVVSIVAGAAVATREAIQARRADDTAQAVNDFLRNDLLAQASAAAQSGPSRKPDPNLTVRTALDRAAAKIESRFAARPEVEAAIRNTIGEAYADLGAYPDARTHLTRALALDRRVLGDSDRVTLRAMNRVARVAYLQGRYPDAEKLFTEAVDAQRRVLGPDHPDTLSSMNDLAVIYNVLARYPEAAALDTQVLDIRRRTLGPEHPDTLTTMHNLAIVYRHQARFGDAEALHKQALEARRRVLGPEHPFTVSSIANLAAVYLDENRSADAAPLFQEAMDIRRRVLGPDHPDTLGTVSSLAIIDVGLGRYEKANTLFTQGLESWRRQFGDVDPNTPIWIQGVAYTAALLGRRAESEALFRQAVEMCSRVQGADHPATLNILSDVAFLYQREGRYALAETFGADVLAKRRRVLGAEHPDTIASMADAAMTYASEGKFAQSEVLAREAWDRSRKVQPDSWVRFYAESLLGESLAGVKRYGEAEPLLLEGYKGMSDRKDQIIAPAWFAVDRARDWIAQLYDSWDKPERAVAWRQPAPRTPGVASAAQQPSSH